MLQILTPFRIGTLDPRHRSLKQLKNLNSSALILLYFSFRKTTLCYVSPSLDLQISLVINVYFLIHFFVYLENGGIFELKFWRSEKNWLVQPQQHVSTWQQHIFACEVSRKNWMCFLHTFAAIKFNKEQYRTKLQLMYIWNIHFTDCISDIILSWTYIRQGNDQKNATYVRVNIEINKYTWHIIKVR